MSDQQVNIDFRGSAAGFSAATATATRDLDEMKREVAATGDAAGQASEGMDRMKTAVAAAATVVGTAFVSTMRAAYVSTVEFEQSMARLETVVKATGFAAGLTGAELEEMVQAIEGSTLFDDTDIRAATTLMLTFRNVQGETFRAAMKASADLAATMGGSLHGAAMMLGKALENPEQGLTALRRAGISFSESQKDLIKDMVESGRQAEAMNLILQTLREQGIDGTAQAMRTGISAATKEMSDSWDDFLKAIGRTETFQGAITGLAEKVRLLKEVIEDGNWLSSLGAALTFGAWTPASKPRAAAATDPNRAAADAGAAAQAARQMADLEDRLGRENEATVAKWGRRAGSAGKSPLDRMLERGRQNEMDAYYSTGGEETMREVGARQAIRSAEAAAREEDRLNRDLIRRAQEHQQEILDVVSQTESGKLDIRREAMQSAAQMFEDGAITEQQWLEYAASQTERFADRGKDAFGDLERAIDGWGKRSADALVDFATGAEMTFGSLIDSILRDIARMAMYENVTKPLFAGISDSIKGAGGFSGMFSSLFGGGRASGGPVESGKTYLVGERGPELLHMGGAGNVTPNSALGLQSLRVEIRNEGRPQEVVSAAPRFDPEGMVVSILMRDIDRNGPISQGMSRSFGLSRMGMGG